MQKKSDSSKGYKAIVEKIILSPARWLVFHHLWQHIISGVILPLVGVLKSIHTFPIHITQLIFRLDKSKY